MESVHEGKLIINQSWTAVIVWNFNLNQRTWKPKDIKIRLIFRTAAVTL